VFLILWFTSQSVNPTQNGNGLSPPGFEEANPIDVDVDPHDGFIATNWIFHRPAGNDSIAFSWFQDFE
jgi:hypothetical protein